MSYFFPFSYFNTYFIWLVALAWCCSVCFECRTQVCFLAPPIEYHAKYPYSTLQNVHLVTIDNTAFGRAMGWFCRTFTCLCMEKTFLLTSPAHKAKERDSLLVDRLGAVILDFNFTFISGVTHLLESPSSLLRQTTQSALLLDKDTSDICPSGVLNPTKDCYCKKKPGTLKNTK